jgi:hypothetical protein
MPDSIEGYLHHKADRETLRFYVQTAIFCQFTGRPLDVRHAVAVTVTSPAGDTRTYAIAAAHWDARKDKVLARMPAGYTLAVLDGRKLFGRPGPRKLRPARPATAPSPQRLPRAPRVSGRVPRARP